MLVRSLREFQCIVDIIIMSLKQDDYMDIALTFSGDIKRGKNDGNAEYAHVDNAVAKVIAQYDVNGCVVGSTTVKKVVMWLQDIEDVNRYIRVNNYLTFLSTIDSLEINAITINGINVLDKVTNEENYLHIGNFLRVFVLNSDFDNIKVNITNGTKHMSFIYVEEQFTRMVKYNNIYTLYINSGEAINRVYGDWQLSGFATCIGVPSVPTQLSYFRRKALENNCEFNYKIEK